MRERTSGASRAAVCYVSSTLIMVGLHGDPDMVLSCSIRYAEELKDWKSSHPGEAEPSKKRKAATGSSSGSGAGASADKKAGKKRKVPCALLTC